MRNTHRTAHFGLAKRPYVAPQITIATKAVSPPGGKLTYTYESSPTFSNGPS